MTNISEFLPESILALDSTASAPAANTKQRCPVCDDMHFVRRNVPFGDKDFGKAFPCPACRVERIPPPETRGVAVEQSEWTLANFPGDRDAKRAAQTALEQNARIYIFWSRAFGVGKTGILYAIVNQSVRNGKRALYKTVPELLDELRAGYRNNTFDAQMDYLKTVDALALDEFHRYYDRRAQNADWSEGSPSWASEKLFQIIDHRYQRFGSLLTVIGTNHQPDKGALDPLESRFGDSMRCKIIEVKGGDLRPHAEKIAKGVTA